MTNLLGLNSYIEGGANNEKRFQSFCRYPCVMTPQCRNNSELLPFAREHNVSLAAKNSVEYSKRDNRRHTLQRSAVR